MKQLEAFIQADPDDRYSRVSLATAYLNSMGMQGKVEETLEPLPHADPLATALRVESKLKQGRVDEAEELLNASGDHPRLVRLRGRLASMRHDYQAAIRHYQAALTAEPYDRVSFTELGQMLSLAEDKSMADKYLNQAKHLNDLYNLFNGVRQADRENQPLDLAEFGKTCEAAGLIDEAAGWYQLAIRKEPLDIEAQQAMRRLRSLAEKNQRRITSLSSLLICLSHLRSGKTILISKSSTHRDDTNELRPDPQGRLGDRRHRRAPPSWPTSACSIR